MASKPLLSADDLAWAAATSKQLIEAKGVAAAPGYPFIDAYVTTWKEKDGTSPHDAMRGSISWGARGYHLYVPAVPELRKWKAKNPALVSEFEAFVAAAAIHELAHFRQHQRKPEEALPAGAKPSDPPSDQLAHYYSHPLEAEAHAAQTAYLLHATGLGPEAALSNSVAERITSRLDPLRDSEDSAAYAAFLVDLETRVAEFLRDFTSYCTGENR